MKNLFLIVSSLLLMFLLPLNGMKDIYEVVGSEASSLTEGNDYISMSESVHSDILYDEDQVVLSGTFSSHSDDVIPCRLNPWGQQLRIMTSRLQFRCSFISLMLKKLSRLLSVHLTTLINHISQVYSSFKLLCWQYPTDCYVFAFRQIII